MPVRWSFVGRDREVVRLLDGIERGVGAVVFGPSGVGKTALVWEVARQAEATRRVERLVGQGSTSFPMQAFARLLPHDVDLDDVQRAAHVQHALRSLDGRPPALLVVDDAHRLDGASGTTLVELAGSGSAVVVATARSDEVAPPWSAQLWRGGSGERLDLGPFSVAEVDRVLRAALGGEVDPACVRTLADLTQGNALALRELVASSVDDGVLVDRDGVWALDGEPSIGPGVRDLVESRLGDLPSDLREALEVVALGDPLPVGAAERVAGTNRLEELEARRLIGVTDTVAGTVVTMAHPLWGQVVQAAMPRLRIRRLHLDLARALEDEHRPPELVRAALWRLEAGVVDDPRALLAAAGAARPFSLDTAEELARAAVDADPSLGAVTLLASILTSKGRPADAGELLGKLPSASLDPDDRELVLFMQSVGTGLLGGDPKAGIAMLDEPGSSARLRGMQSSLLLVDGRVVDAHLAASAVLDDPDAAADASARTVAGIGAVGSLLYLGRFAELRRRYEVAERDASDELLANPHGLGQIQVNAFPAMAEEGALDEAADQAQQRLDASVGGERDWERSRWAYVLGRVRLLRGDLTGAANLLRLASATPAPFDLPFHPYNVSFLARALAGAGSTDEARQVLDAVPDDLPRFALFEAEWELAEASILAGDGRLAAAAERAAWAAELATVRNLWTVVLVASHDAARYGGASSVRRLAADAAGRVEGDLPAARAALVEAQAAGDAAALDLAARSFADVGALLFAAEAAAQAARANQQDGRATAAARSEVRHRQLLAACPGASCPWLAGATSLDPLTRREQEVAILAAAGRHDAELATELGVSVRTIQTHLGRAYVKLGIHSRRELASALLPGTTTRT